MQKLVALVNSRKKRAQLKQCVAAAKGKQPVSQTRAHAGIGHPDWNEQAGIIRHLNEHLTTVTGSLVPDNGQLLTVLGMEWVFHSDVGQVARIMRRRLWSWVNEVLRQPLSCQRDERSSWNSPRECPP